MYEGSLGTSKNTGHPLSSLVRMLELQNTHYASKNTISQSSFL